MKKGKIEWEIRSDWLLRFVFTRLFVSPARSLSSSPPPSLFCLFLGLSNCTSQNGISRKEIGGGRGGCGWKGGIDGTGVGTEELHTWFPSSPWSEAFLAMRVHRSARPPACRMVSRWQSCPIMRALWDSQTKGRQKLLKEEYSTTEELALTGLATLNWLFLFFSFFPTD